MGILDSVFGRSKVLRPDLDRLFALPAAALTLQAGTGFAPTGAGSVCFSGVEGGSFTRLKEEVRDLLDVDAVGGGARGASGAAAPASFSRDAYGYTWLVARRPADDVVTLVNDLHAVNTLLQEAGFGPHLLCSLTAFRAPGHAHELALVYLYKRGTFYPFAPRTDRREARDNALELEVRALLAGDLPMEPDLERWFPLWGAPGLGGGDGRVESMPRTDT
ncbi:hypothetical protein R6L23_00460 [Streptomyces sp. SR27]|uniref:PspA-associated protein PspAB n=1 Tax=Streptomyces sp. SR27 TaxID=3076630 RepID=UPI00295B0C8D|nr:hypothetical protein [Streptomyces sp. SR27]MDV9186730.1 hypothetical protein [Streptomyces sp. SR27]